MELKTALPCPVYTTPKLKRLVKIVFSKFKALLFLCFKVISGIDLANYVFILTLIKRLAIAFLLSYIHNRNHHFPHFNYNYNVLVLATLSFLFYFIGLLKVPVYLNKKLKQFSLIF